MGGGGEGLGGGGEGGGGEGLGGGGEGGGGDGGGGEGLGGGGEGVLRLNSDRGLHTPQVTAQRSLNLNTSQDSRLAKVSQLC